MIVIFEDWVFAAGGRAKVRGTLSGSLALPAESLQVHVSQVSELRDEWVISVSAVVEVEDGKEFEVTFIDLPDGLYEISGCTAQVVGQRFQSQDIQVTGQLNFRLPSPVSAREAESLVRSMRSNRLQHLRATLVTPAAAAAGGSHFEMVIFYGDADIGGLQQLHGVSILPLQEGGDISYLASACARYVHATMGVNVEPSPLMIDDFKRDNPLFAVHIHDVFAKDRADAISFARDYANDFATMVAFERGERPRAAMMFLRDQEGHSLFPLFPRPNRNMIKPRAHAHAHMLERYQPKLKRSPSARLVAELFGQALAEPERGFRMFRFWSILETIAVRHVPKGIKVKLIDGTPIMHTDKKGNQVQRETNEKSARVYEYLRTRLTLPTQSLAVKWSDGRAVSLEGSKFVVDDTASIKAISLWAEVSAFYKIRNAVVHSGVFDVAAAQADPSQAIDAFMFTSAARTLEDFARAATLNEIELA